MRPFEPSAVCAAGASVSAAFASVGFEDDVVGFFFEALLFEAFLPAAFFREPVLSSPIVDSMEFPSVASCFFEPFFLEAAGFLEATGFFEAAGFAPAFFFFEAFTSAADFGAFLADFLLDFLAFFEGSAFFSVACAGDGDSGSTSAPGAFFEAFCLALALVAFLRVPSALPGLFFFDVFLAIFTRSRRDSWVMKALCALLPLHPRLLRRQGDRRARLARRWSP